MTDRATGTSRGAGHRLSRWALPGELAAFDGAPPGRRTARDWLVDAALFAFAALWWLWLLDDFVRHPDPEYLAIVDSWMVTIDPWVGAAGCLALWGRRRFPLALAIAMLAVLLFSSTGYGAVLVAIFTVAIHRGWLASCLVTACYLLPATWWALTWQPTGMPAWAYVGFVMVSLMVPLGWGMMIRFRRQLLVTLRRDAQREREEHGQRLVGARRAERERIAREMHDVLAHRISLLSVHAGALAYRTTQASVGAGEALRAAEVTEAVQVIRDNAHQALAELGDVLSVLRADDGADGPDGSGRGAPPPLLVDLPRLVDEARAAGQRVRFELDGELPATAPPRPQEQRTVYRVVQEGLTNARKHAPGAPVTVRVAATPGAGLAVAVTNPVPQVSTEIDIPGAGAGLTGLAERVALEGGKLEHGPVDGAFRLAAHLPWRE